MLQTSLRSLSAVDILLLSHDMTQCIKYWVRLVKNAKPQAIICIGAAAGHRVFARYCTGTGLGTCGKQIRLKMVYTLFICFIYESKIAICKNYIRKLKIFPKHCNINILKQLLKLHTICMQTSHICIKDNIKFLDVLVIV